MNLDKLSKILEKEPAFRKKQADQAIFQDLVENWLEVKTLPLDLRKKLDKECPLKIDSQATVSQDEKAIKALVIFNDGQKVETVLMRHGDGRNTICVSSQVGCPLGCVFCATGKLGFKRNLKSMEIVEQALFFARYLKTKSPARIATQSVAGGEKVTNIVFMGMGEPFLNYDNVLSAIRTLNDKDGFGLGARHFSISTAGIPEGIRRLAEEKLQVNLALSLHAPTDELRRQLMPVDKKYPLEEVLKSIDLYIKLTNRRVMFEYIMIDGVNDSDDYAKKLVKIAKRPLVFINLISYNPTPQNSLRLIAGQAGILRSSPAARVKKFKEILEKNNIIVTQRHRFGSDVQAACGQLANRKRLTRPNF